MLVRDGVRNVDLIFHPVGVLREAQSFDVLRVVGIVVDGGHRTQLVEAFDQHTFSIHVGKAQRSYDMRHAAFFAPLLHGAYQGFGHFGVVSEVYPAEADLLLAPCLVGPIVDDGGHAAYEPSVLIGQEVVGLAELKGSVLPAVERVQHVVVEVGHGVGISFV